MTQSQSAGKRHQRLGLGHGVRLDGHFVLVVVILALAALIKYLFGKSGD